MIGRLFPGVEHLQNSHPLFVHYPLAFLAGAALFYLLAWISRKEMLATIAFAMLIVGTISAGVAIGTGLYAEDGVMVARSVRAKLLDRHKDLMIATGVMALAATSWALWQRPFPRRARPLFILLLLAMLVTMVKGADDGARMVYDYNAGGSACGQPIEFEK